MASNVVKVSLLADAKGFTKGMKEAEDSSTRFGKTAKGVGGVVAGFFALQAVSGVVTFLGDATKAAMEDDAAQQDLALALKNTTGATDDQIAAAEEYIDKTARATGVTDDELRPALETLTRATGDLEEAQDLLSTAMDIATATGKPLETVVAAIAKAAQNGSTGGLARLGVKIRDVNGDLLSFDEILQEATRTMGGATAVAAETAQGKMDRLTVAFEETKEEIGTAFIPILMDAADAVLKVVEAFNTPPTTEQWEQIPDAMKDTTMFAGPLRDGVEGLVDSFGALGDLLGITVAPTIGETYDVLDSLTPPIREVEDATKDMTVATRDSTDAFYDHQSAVRASTDPVFALAEAERDQAEAIGEAYAAAEEYGTGSKRHLDALGKVRDAALDVQDAEKAMGDQSGTTRSTMETHLRSLAVYTEGQIQLMLDEFDRINAYSFQAKTIAITHKVTGGGVQEYQTGGTVPGPEGKAQVAIVHGGETVIPAHHKGGGHAPGMVNNITINAGLGSDPNAISKALVEHLQRYQRANGPLPIRTRP